MIEYAKHRDIITTVYCYKDTIVPAQVGGAA